MRSGPPIDRVSGPPSIAHPHRRTGRPNRRDIPVRPRDPPIRARLRAATPYAPTMMSGKKGRGRWSTNYHAHAARSRPTRALSAIEAAASCARLARVGCTTIGVNTASRNATRSRSRWGFLRLVSIQLSTTANRSASIAGRRRGTTPSRSADHSRLEPIHRRSTARHVRKLQPGASTRDRPTRMS